MHAIAGESIQINRKRSDERLTFTGLHFGDLAAMQHNAADHLYVKMAHVEDTLTGLATNGKRLRQNFVQSGVAGGEALGLIFNALDPLLDQSLEITGLLPQLLVRELLVLLFQSVDLVHTRTYSLDLTLI